MRIEFDEDDYIDPYPVVLEVLGAAFKFANKCERRVDERVPGTGIIGEREEETISALNQYIRAWLRNNDLESRALVPAYLTND